MSILFNKIHEGSSALPLHCFDEGRFLTFSSPVCLKHETNVALHNLNKEQKRPTTDTMAGEWGDREGNVMLESLLWQLYNTRNYLIALNIVNSGNKVTGVLNAFKNLRHIYC